MSCETLIVGFWVATFFFARVTLNQNIVDKQCVRPVFETCFVSETILTHFEAQAPLQQDGPTTILAAAADRP